MWCDIVVPDAEVDVGVGTRSRRRKQGPVQAGTDATKRMDSRAGDGLVLKIASWLLSG